VKIAFILNNRNVTVETPPDRRVVDLLREDLGLTGTKEACGMGDCGACTILVNGRTKLSCLMLAAQLEGTEIVTIEGIGSEEEHQIVQDSFIETGAVQCGFCTPGMVLATLHLLKANPDPDRTEIRLGLSGNLCRCTGYQKIVDAVEHAAARMPRKQES
jgi:carbon-monoxide dehydrogenase small subunit